MCVLPEDFVLNKLKGDILGLDKVWQKLYMCVVLVYFLTLCMSIFDFFMLDDILVTL